MNSLIAKPIVKNQYWVVTNGTEKVGNVTASGTGYELKMHGATSYFDSTKNIQKQFDIEFVTSKPKEPAREVAFSHYPTPGPVYNSMLDVKRKLHIFTKTPKSKCYHVAGWFSVKQGSTYEAIFCPKYILVQRYDYLGPFKSKTDAILNKQ